MLFVILFCSSQISSQTADFKNKFSDADYYFLFEDYSKALKIYLELYDSDKTNANINYLIGLCYVQSVKDKEKIKAIPFLEYASKNINPKYVEGKYKETKAPIYSLYYLAFAYKLNNQFEKAIESYRAYISYLNPKDREEMHNALKEIEACTYAMKLIQVPVNLESIKGNDFADKNKDAGVKADSSVSVNVDNSFIKSTSEESFPIVSFDGSFMIFSMGVNNSFPQEVQSLNFDFDQYKTDDIYYSLKNANGQWETPVNIMKQLKAKSQVAPVCLSHDGKTLYFVQDDSDNGNIYSSKFENGNWTPMTLVKGDINTRQWESHASLSPDDKTMYFTSARKGGFGGLDIYKSTLKDNGEWGKAENLGQVINTPEDEETPFLLPDGKTLFFSSRGHKNIGGFDIFLSNLDKDGKWSKPLNAGYSLNTVNNDFAYINIIDKQLALTPLNRTDLRDKYSGTEDKGNSYKLIINTENPIAPSFDIKGTVVFKPGKMNYPDNFEISVLDSIRNVKLPNISKNDLSGEYSFKASAGVYLIKFATAGYKEYTQRVLLPEIYTPSTIIINVELIPTDAGEDVVAQADIVFDYEKNFPDRETNRKVNLITYKNVRDSLRLLAENTEKNKDTQKNNVNSDITKNNETQLTADNKNKDSKTSNLNNKNNQQDGKNIVADNKDTKNNKDQSTNKNNADLSGNTVVNNVLFDFDCVKPKEFKDNLDKLAKYITSNQNCKVLIEGHSDNQGEENYKQIISDMRADFINKYLVENGALKGNIATKGYSSTKPIASEISRDTRKYNRRAEFKVSGECNKLIIEPIVVPEISGIIYSVKVSNLLFAFDSLNISENPNLDKLAAYLKQNTTCVVEIVGHSDAQGKDSYKQFVSQERANNIRKTLIRMGVNSVNLSARGESDSKQISIDNSPETRKFNRRVEFIVLKEGDQKLIIEPIKVPTAFQLK